MRTRAILVTRVHLLSIQISRGLEMLASLLRNKELLLKLPSKTTGNGDKKATDYTTGRRPFRKSRKTLSRKIPYTWRNSKRNQENRIHTHRRHSPWLTRGRNRLILAHLLSKTTNLRTDRRIPWVATLCLQNFDWLFIFRVLMECHIIWRLNSIFILKCVPI